jgi:hypothetical protein
MLDGRETLTILQTPAATMMPLPRTVSGEGSVKVKMNCTAAAKGICREPK